MRSILLGGVAALAFSFAASAENATDTTNPPAVAPAAQPSTTAAPAATTKTDTTATAPAPATKSDMTATAATGAKGGFITQQQVGEVRAPKLVGVSVYDKDNKSIGKIDDLLMDKEGKVQAVVIGVGGFLGIGKKDVALPYDAIHWQTEQRTVATNGVAPGAAPGTTNNSLAGTTTPTNNAAAQPQQKTVDPAKTEAYNGYPDRAVVDMSQQQLKDAPEFKYASQTMNSDGTTNTNATNK